MVASIQRSHLSEKLCSSPVQLRRSMRVTRRFFTVPMTSSGRLLATYRLWSDYNALRYWSRGICKNAPSRPNDFYLTMYDLACIKFLRKAMNKPRFRCFRATQRLPIVLLSPDNLLQKISSCFWSACGIGHTNYFYSVLAGLLIRLWVSCFRGVHHKNGHTVRYHR